MTKSIEIKCMKREVGVCEIDPTICSDLNDANTTEKQLNFPNYGQFQNAQTFEILSPTHLTQVPAFILKKFPKLLQLRMNDAGITILQADRFAVDRNRLVELDIRRNKITKIPAKVFSHLSHLEVINLAYNKIKGIEVGAFDDLPALQYLFLSHNKLKIVKQTAFVGLVNLTELFLDSNTISRVKGGSFNLPNLEIISLKSNRLKSLPTDLFKLTPKLHKAYVSGNDLEHIGKVYDDCMELYVLDLNDNPVLNANLFELADRLPGLSYLYLANAGFKLPSTVPDADEAVDYALTHLDLSNNRLSDTNILLYLRQFKCLKTLELEQNEFIHLNLDQLKGLKQLFPQMSTINMNYNRNLDSSWLVEAKSILESEEVELITEYQDDE